MPQLGETVTEGTITRWMKAVGEQVSRDEPLFEVSTDKVDSEVPAPASGTLTEILVGEGETVEVGARLAVITDGAGGQHPPPAPPQAEPQAAAPAPAPLPAPPPPPRRPSCRAAAPATPSRPQPPAAPPPPPAPPPRSRAAAATTGRAATSPGRATATAGHRRRPRRPPPRRCRLLRRGSRPSRSSCRSPPAGRPPGHGCSRRWCAGCWSRTASTRQTWSAPGSGEGSPGRTSWR